ncbi:MAG: hypothetical protein JNJ85_00305 [Candidatus Kapabacteria bacterium]|nr:hypothetical protein [Candidatus Kapabacteria bacterium]
MKKSLNRKEVMNLINDRLKNGISRQVLLEELAEQYYDKKTIAMLIASTINPVTKEKYRTVNMILFSLLVLSIIIKILIGIAQFSSISLYLIPIAFLTPILSILFASEVLKFRGYIYNILGIIAVASLLNTLSKMSDAGIYEVLDIVLIAAIIALSFYLGNKMFPNYGLLGPKKDSNGNILLE